MDGIPFLNRDKKVGAIFNAQFKQVLNNFKKLPDVHIAEISAKPQVIGLQEKEYAPPVNLSKNFSWYDFSVKAAGNEGYEQRFTGLVDTGLPSNTDPVMGSLI